jgi:BASS family bile acid:Na+ symporter
MEAMCSTFDSVQLKFSSGGLLLLDVSLAIIMFGVALNLQVKDFRELAKRPLAPLIGVFSQFIALPALTLALVWGFDWAGNQGWIGFCPSMALGMFLVAACPGGNVSNFMSFLAKGNVALSVSLSAVATLGAIFMTPINFLFWSGFYPPAQAIMQEVGLNPTEIFLKVLLILGIPLLLGMFTAHRFRAFSDRIKVPIQRLSVVIFGLYVLAALGTNWAFFMEYVGYIIGLVVFHNLLALLLGYQLARMGRLPQQDRRTIAIETGIQNSGLALVLIFGPIFDGLGGMAMIAALWGVWHLVSGLSLATLWSSRPIISVTSSPLAHGQK